MLDALSLSFQLPLCISDSLGISLQKETVPVGGICHAFAALPDTHVQYVLLYMSAKTTVLRPHGQPVLMLYSRRACVLGSDID